MDEDYVPQDAGTTNKFWKFQFGILKKLQTHHEAHIHTKSAREEKTK